MFISLSVCRAKKDTKILLFSLYHVRLLKYKNLNFYDGWHFDSRRQSVTVVFKIKIGRSELVHRTYECIGRVRSPTSSAILFQNYDHLKFFLFKKVYKKYSKHLDR